MLESVRWHFKDGICIVFDLTDGILVLLVSQIAFCAGSFSTRKDNVVVEMAKPFSHRIHFAHLENKSLSFQKV